MHGKGHGFRYDHNLQYSRIVYISRRPTIDCATMLGLLRFTVVLAAFVTPCLSSFMDNTISLSDDTRPSVPLSRPFEYFPGSDQRFVRLDASGAEITWAPGVPEEQKGLKCFKFVLQFENDALLHMDADAVDSVCAQDAAVDEHGTQLLASFDSIADHIDDKSTVHIGEFLLLRPGKLVHHSMFTPFFVNCCSNISAVSLEAELVMYQDVHKSISLASVGEFALPWFYVVRFLHLYSLKHGWQTTSLPQGPSNHHNPQRPL